MKKRMWCWVRASFSLLSSFTSSVCWPLVLKSRRLSARTEMNSKRSTPETLVSLFGLIYESRSRCSSTRWVMTSFLQSMLMSLMKHP